ncbi:CRISPR-associated RAMP protein, Csm5 family [Thermodesulfobium narugense DSM 14796]|uniref:CRISPR system Cms protein Csm5 n=1 Tax=Thermodesulfobium narugense DSM 14796 TaxID=747365 RepID=M1E7P4_9BACT|nr:type III-A CRISPR-associated RAMP protein Csm5 [Thermodesulfobium narugense]AEE15336.1 CRISPR-associated RAMP protein, Csm5 family [Thermodesulfobium narugense DSM 14796]
MAKRQIFETKTYNLKILSPIHIGTGEDMDPMDYVYKDKKLYKISSDTFFNILEKRGLKEKIIKENISKLNIKTIARNINDIFDRNNDDYVYYIEIEDSLEGSFATRYFNPDAQMQIGLTLRSGDDIIIPGSSTKGAIRTAFLNFLSEQYNSEVYNNLLQGRNLMLEKDDERNLKNIINDPFKFVSVSDVSISNETRIVEMFRVGSKGKGIPIVKEVIVPNKDKNNNLTISIKTNLRDCWNNKPLNLPKLKKELINLDLKTLLEKTDRFYRSLLKVEKDVYKRAYPSFDNSFFALIDKEKGYLIRLGFGCGNLSYTIKGCSKEVKPGKTRFLVSLKNKMLPLGYAILTEKNEAYTDH